MSEQSTAKNGEPMETYPLRVQLPIYAAGIFSNGAIHLASVIVPLWVLMIEQSPLIVGIVIASRHALPVLLSIHGGALMDRIGIRRVMIGFAIVGAIVPFLFPLAPWLWAIIILQMLSGIATAIGWIGTQAQIGAVMKGHATYAGRVTFFNRFSTLVGPPATGYAWDLFGPWGGFGFLGIWGIALLIASITLPIPKTEAAQDKAYEDMTIRDVLPRVSDYVEAAKLMVIPAIAFVVAVTILRHAGNGIQTSFYVVYLEQIGYSATFIGILISASSVLGAIGSLSAAWLARYFSLYRTLVVCVCIAIVLIAVTPILGTFFLLFVASALRGGVMGVSQPLLIALMQQSAGKSHHGKAAGLRTTANRVSVMAVPVIMGAVAEYMGIEMSFYVMGGILVVMMIGVAIKSRPAFEPAGAKEGTTQ
jgi:MFS family permease